jgi:tetratricopeptide (TPR) repeat protein
MASAPADSSGRLAPRLAALPDDLSERISDFSGRSWVFRRVADWLGHEDSSLFLLTGEPGTGKSALAARLLQLSQGNGNGGQPDFARAVDLAWFCQYSKTLTLDPIEFISALSARLAATSPVFLDALAAAEANADIRINVKQTVAVAEPGAAVSGVVIEINGAISRRAAFARLLLKPFQAMLDAGWRQRFVVLMDALDESLGYLPGDGLAAVLADVGRELPLRLLVTSRPDPRVIGLLGPAAVDLGRDQPDDVSDVFEYARSRLSRFPEPDRSRIAGDVARAGGENFLYARYVLDDILSRPGGLDTIEDLPAGLDAVYRDFLNRELATDQNAWEQRFRPMLGAISVARGDGLTADQLSRITGLKPSQVADTLKRTLQYLSGAYPAGPFRIYHKSFVEYLGRPGDHQVFSEEANESVASHLLEQWRAGGALDDYGVANLTEHLADAGLTEALVDLIDRRWMQLRLERGGYAYTGFAADVRTALNAVLAAPEPRLDWIARLQAADMVVQDATLMRDDDDLRLLARLGRGDEAIAAVMLRPDPKERVSGLLAIRHALGPEDGRSPGLLESARQLALSCRDPDVRLTCLRSLILAAAHGPVSDIESLVDAARLAVQAIKGESDRAIGGRDLVRTLAAAGRTGDAGRVTAGITDVIQQGWARVSLVRALVEAGDLRVAPAILPEYTEEGWRWDKDIHAQIRVEAVVGLAVGLERAGESMLSRRFFEEAESTAARIEDDFNRGDALFDVARGLASCGSLAEARRVAESMSGWSRERALHAVVEGHVADGDLGAASELTVTMSPTTGDGVWRALAERDVAIGLVAAGDLDEGLRRIADADPGSRVTSLCRAADALHVGGDTETAGDMLARAEVLTTQVPESKRIDALRTVVRFCLSTGRLPEATRCYAQAEMLAAERRDLRGHAAAVSKLAACLAHCDHPAADEFFQHALTLVASLRDFDRHDAERALAEDALRCSSFDLAWQVAAGNRRDLRRVPLWCELGRALAPIDAPRARSAFAHATALTRSMNATARSKHLHDVSRILADLGWFDDAEAVMPDIDDEAQRSSAMVDLAQTLFAHDAPRAERLLREAEALALQGFGDRGQLLSVTRGWLAIGNVREPSRIVPTLEDDLHRVQALAPLAGALARRGDQLGRTLLDDGLVLATRCHEGDTELLEQTKFAAYERKWAGAEEELPPRALDSSLWSGWFWDEPQYRSQAMRWLASALTENADPRATRIFAMAHEAADAVPYENARDTTLRELGETMIAAGDVDGAARVFADIHDDHARSGAGERLVAACTTYGRLDDAQRVAESVTSEYEARKLFREVALGYARAGKPVAALRSVHEKSLDDYLAALGAILIEQSATTAILEALAAGAAVAAWKRPDWDDIWRRITLHHDKALARDRA